MGLLRLIKRIIREHIGFLLFIFLFTLYFSSSVGVMNSLDTPQYFTTEAIFRHRSLDMNYFKDDPHYFISPDFARINGNVLNLHGFVLSIIALPLHYLSSLIHGLFSANLFPTQVITANFLYELCITSLFTLFSVIGLMLVWKSLVLITHRKWIPTLMILFTGVGSSLWKWSSAYQRQGILVFLIGGAIYLLASLMVHKRKPHYWLWCLILVLSFGIDLYLFISLLGFLVLTTLYVYLEQGNIQSIDLYAARLPLFTLLFYLGLISILNFRIYGFFQPFQAIYRDTDNPFYSSFFEGKKMNDRYKVLMSSPILHTLPVILFNRGKLPSTSYTHISNMSETVKEGTSYYYLARYNFFGLFTITPFLLFSLCIVFMKKKYKLLTLFGFWVFSVNIILQSIFIVFWGGTQYDVRYFYPYILCLIVPATASIIQLAERKSKGVRIATWATFIFLGMFSIVMGWFATISMYMPALTGERRIWLDILTFSRDYKLYSLKDYLEATFPNRENAWIAVASSVLIYAIWLQYKILMKTISEKD